MLDTLIKNVTAVTMDDEGHLYSDAYIAIKDGKISYIGTEAPQEQVEKVIDGRGMIAMPGLVNTHSHAAMSQDSRTPDREQYRNRYPSPPLAALPPDCRWTCIQ